MIGTLHRGRKVHLSALDERDLNTRASFTEDAAFLRHLHAGPACPQGPEQLRGWLKSAQDVENGFTFGIRTAAEGKLIGCASLEDILWAHQVAWLSIGIGDETERGKGYGGEALDLLLHFAFRELNLRRLQLTGFSYNRTAIGLYERAGFHREGTYREFLNRDLKTYDMYGYGLLRREWQPLEQRAPRAASDPVRLRPSAKTLLETLRARG